MEVLFKLALTIGMRRGELMGLKWQDIDMEHATLHVQRALTRMPTTMGGGYQEAEPKTEKSRRTIVLPDFAFDALRNHGGLSLCIMNGCAKQPVQSSFMQPYSGVHPPGRLRSKLVLQSEKAASPWLHLHIPRRRSYRFGPGHHESQRSSHLE